MSNTLQLVTILQEELDRQAMQAATSGWMEPNADQVKYTGGSEIKIGLMDMDGLGDYDRVTGFAPGSVNLKFETREMTMDRARTFSIDAMDVDETSYLATAANAMGEFQRTKVVPEIDAYRYSKLATYALEAGRVTDGYALDAKTIIKQLTNDAYKIYDEVGDEIELVVSMSSRAHHVLVNNEKISKTLEVGSFSSNEINFDFKKLDNLFIRLVPNGRMLSEYLFLSGRGDQNKGGFRPTDNARQINWIITARRTPIAVSKQDKIRVFTPDINQQMDAYKLDYRRYHELWVLPNQMNKLYANIAAKA
jgi:hypothetical protein